jgi:N-acylglucosamine 2-epimerase
MMHAASLLDDYGLYKQCLSILKSTFRRAWDHEIGGLFRFIGTTGPVPVGTLLGIPYEQQIVDTWDMKLWWVHTEYLYASMLAAKWTGDEECTSMAEKIHAYTFSVFPNPDRSIGEWIQKRDRKGNPLDKVVALPVKDPYHATRDLLLLISLFG